MCTPEYVERYGPFDGPESLLNVTLLQLEPMQPEWITWTKWFRTSGIDMNRASDLHTITFNSYPLLLEAAVSGQGVALGGLYIIDNLIKEKKLTPVSDAEFRTGLTYYLTTSKDIEDTQSTDQVVKLSQYLLASV